MVRLGVPVFGGLLGDGDGERYKRDEDKVVGLLKWPSYALGLFARMFKLELKGSTLSEKLRQRILIAF